jgi:protein-disulfide isomerase
MRGEDESPRLTIPVSPKDHVQGLANAPVTLLEYGDYECPYCGAAYPIVKEVQKRLGGQLRFVFRNFPLANMHPHATLAAEAAEVVGALDHFWEMHDMLYEHQSALAEPDLVGYARKLGVDPAKFVAELRRSVYAERVREDFASGVRSGVNGTPTFYINGVRHNGSYELEELLDTIGSALPPDPSGKSPPPKGKSSHVRKRSSA